MTSRGDVVIVAMPFVDYLFTIRQQDILRTIGNLTDSAMVQVQACLKATLDLS